MSVELRDDHRSTDDADPESGTLRVLVVEDSEVDYELLLLEFRKRDGRVVSERVETREAMEAALSERSWDIIISDWSLPCFSGLSALAVVRARAVDLPFIIVSGTIGEDTAVEALRNGAHDFVVKGKLARLLPAVERELREAKVRSERDRMQQQLMISDRMASVGILAAGVAHEINNPLACVLANLELTTSDLSELAGRVGEIGELCDQVRDARDAADRIRLIVRDLRIFSRVEEDKRVPVDVQGVLESSLRMAWNEIRHRARLIKEYEKVPPVMASEPRLGQVFLNMIVNAAQAISEGRAESNQLRVRVRADTAARVVVEIADTGPGMSKEVVRRLFTPFFTTKAAGLGTGLGLAICKRIVTDLGGEITAESEVGVGTTFRVVLPACPAESEPAAPRGTPLSVVDRRGRILVVDDDPMIAATIRRTLSPEHDVTAVCSVAEALRRLEGGERFDVILSDLMMPQMTGMDLHAELSRSIPAQADRIVFVSGGAFTPSAREFLERVSNHRIEKPFDAEQLRACINERVR